MQQQLLDFFVGQLESGDYTDLELTENLINKALALNSDPVIALRAITEIVRNGTGNDLGMGWGFDRNTSRFFYENHTDNRFDDSGFGDLADTQSPNQIAHFVGIAYIAAFQQRAEGINSDILVWGQEARRFGSQTAEQSNIDRDLGYIAVDFAESLTVNYEEEIGYLGPQERQWLTSSTVGGAIVDIQSYSYSESHPVRDWWDNLR